MVVPLGRRATVDGMGIHIDRDEFEKAEYARFAERLEACLAALRALLGRPGFGVVRRPSALS
jgi:hypothetical protein